MKVIKNEWVLYPLKWVIAYLSYQPLMVTVLTSVGFLIVGWINFSNGEPSLNTLRFLAPIIKWLGFEETGTYGNEEIFAAFTKVSFVFGVAGFVLENIFKLVFKYKRKFKKVFGYILISAAFLFAVLSCFSAWAKDGAISIIPMLVAFWVLAMGSHAWYLLLGYLMEVIDRRGWERRSR